MLDQLLFIMILTDNGLGEFDNLKEENMTTSEILKMAMKVYKGFLPDYYRIEIINDESGEIVDYIDERE